MTYFAIIEFAKETRGLKVKAINEFHGLVIANLRPKGNFYQIGTTNIMYAIRVSAEQHQISERILRWGYDFNSREIKAAQRRYLDSHNEISSVEACGVRWLC